MLFAVVAATAAIHSLGARPDVSSKVLSHVRTVELARPAGAIHVNTLATLKAAQDIVDGIMLETGNATEHMTPEEEELLESVIALIRTNMYGSMNESHVADRGALDRAIEEIERCNIVIKARQSAHGDIGRFYQAAKDMQLELNRLKGIVDEKTDANETAWEDFQRHMDEIYPAPECPEFPERTMSLLNIYFENSAYVHWFSQVRDPYFAQKNVWLAADEALRLALKAHAKEKARLDVKYCDWKRELENGCAAFDMCYKVASEYYLNELVPRVQSDMDSRIAAFKAGEVLISQVEFLLALRESNKAPTDIDTSRFELSFLPLPKKALCDLSPLEDEMWNPRIDCIFELLGEDGACRTADGGVGDHTDFYFETEASCKALCRNDETCVAIEFQTSRAWCEIHTAPIEYSESAWWLPGVECWRKVE